jgi:hypothetical protein
MPTRPASFVLAFTLALAASGSAQAAAGLRGWPRLQGGETEPLCKQALALGRVVHRSTAANLNGVIEAPTDFPSANTFRRVEQDLTGGGGVSAEETVFSIQSKGVGLPTTLYWQSQERSGWRIAIADQPAGSQGDKFSTFFLRDNTQPGAVWDALSDAPPREGAPTPVTDGWYPPLVLRDRMSGADWLILQGESYTVLAPWVVLTPKTGATPLCEVAFRPPFKRATSPLPIAVRRLAAGLDDALGPGRDEGTLHPTARIRIAMSVAWANTALRPWAVADDAYNARAEVDAELARWAEGVPRRQAERAAIRAALAPAERALAGYYSRTYHVAPAKAAAMSRFALDVIYRGHFVFHRDEEPARASNPWPADVR